MWVEIVTATVGVLVLVAVVGTRAVSKGSIQVQLSDAIIAALAAIFVLLLAGRITKIGLSEKGVDIEVVEIFRSASEKKLAPQISTLPVEQLDAPTKGGIADIPRLVERQIPALSFRLATGAYASEAVRQYLLDLTQHPFFRFVIILKQDEQFFGMIDARKLLRTLQDPTSGWSFTEFESVINGGNAADQARLSTIPGLISAAKSVQPETDKLEALERMEALHIDWLPVVTGSFLKGIVERSALTASIIADVAKQFRNSAAR